MKRPKLNQTLFLCLLFVLLAACAGPAAEAPVENAAEAPVVQDPEATSVPAEAGGSHLTQPSDLPAESISQASDHDSSNTPLAATGGDFLTRGRIERPFNANSMDTYFPELDIPIATLYMDEE